MNARALVPALLALTALNGCGDSTTSGLVVKPVQSLAPCASTTERAPPLRPAVLAILRLPAPASDVLATRNGWWFVSAAGQVDVLDGSARTPVLIRQVPLPAGLAAGAHRLALTPDGRHLLVAAGSGAVVIDVARAENGGGSPVLGRLQSPASTPTPEAGAGAIAISNDSQFAFVARSRAGGVAVFDLHAALTSGFTSSGFIGVVPVGLGPVGLAMGPGGVRLYATALAPMPRYGPRVTLAAQSPARSPSAGGVLSVIDVASAERSPRTAVLRSVIAGCEPIGVSTSPDGRYVWVAAVGDHSLLGFDARELLRRPRGSLRAAVRLGTAPSGVVALPSGALLVTDPTPSGGLTVLSASAALAHRPAVTGVLRAQTGTAAVAADPDRRGVLVAYSGFPDVELLRTPTP